MIVFIQAEEMYFTSDYDLPKLPSRTIGAGVRFVPENGVMGMKHFYMLELRFVHYLRSTDLQSNILTMNMKFK